MKRFLAVIRRFFLAGAISLPLCIWAFSIGFIPMWNMALEINSVESAFCIFFLLAPVLYFLFVIISVIYIRRNGQFAEFHQTQSPVVTFFRCLGSDIASPFKNIAHFFSALFDKEAMGRGILIGRFIELIIIIGICATGIILLIL